MNNSSRQNQTAGLSLADICHSFLRRKWKIIGFSAAGFLVAALIWFLQTPVYSSEAKLFIRYIVEARPPSGIGGDAQLITPDPAGANLLNSEVEILNSMDLALQVAETIGPEKILGKGAGVTNKYLAAAILNNGFTVEVIPASDILRIVFQHPTPEIVQPVLEQLINAYLRKHVEIHGSGGAFEDMLTRYTDVLHMQLAQTEADLKKAKTNAVLMSVEDAKKGYSEQISRLREVVFNAQAELAERQAVFQESQKLMPVRVEISTNQPDGAARSPKIESKDISDHPEYLRKQAAQIAGLAARLMVLTNHLEKLTAEAKIIDELEPNVTELQRKKDLEEIKYRHFSTSLDQALFDKELSAGKNSNISVVQTPTPPCRKSRYLAKTLALIVGGGVLCGIGFAGLCVLGELLDESRRRKYPEEPESANQEITKQEGKDSGPTK